MDRCGEVIEIKTNIGEFAQFIAKDCYPKGLDRESYVNSVAIQRMLDKTGGEGGEEPRHLKSFYIY